MIKYQYKLTIFNNNKNIGSSSFLIMGINKFKFYSLTKFSNHEIV